MLWLGRGETLPDDESELAEGETLSGEFVGALEDGVGVLRPVPVVAPSDEKKTPSSSERFCTH